MFYLRFIGARRVVLYWGPQRLITFTIARSATWDQVEGMVYAASEPLELIPSVREEVMQTVKDRLLGRWPRLARLFS